MQRSPWKLRPSTTRSDKIAGATSTAPDISQTSQPQCIVTPGRCNTRSNSIDHKSERRIRLKQKQRILFFFFFSSLIELIKGKRKRKLKPPWYLITIKRRPQQHSCCWIRPAATDGPEHRIDGRMHERLHDGAKADRIQCR